MLLLLILLLASALRLVLLGSIPTSVTGDELSYILSVKSFLLTGYDMSGTIAPWQLLFFHYPPMVLPQAELPYFLLMPFVGGDLSLFAVRFPFALLGVLLVFSVYAVTKELINHKVALIASFFAAISPWLIFINRTAYEMTPAMTFYLLGLLVLLKTKGWKIFYAFPLFILAFYSYIGTKLVFIPFLFLIIAYLYFFKHKRKYPKPYGALALASLGFVAFFVILLQSQSGSRMGDILLPSSPLIIDQVNTLRAVSIDSPLTSLFINKATVYGQILATNLLNSLATPYLFLTGDLFFGMWKHGIFYLLDALFILLGIGYLARKQQSVLLLVGGSILIGFLPEIVHKGDDLFTPHITFIFPFVLILAACGVAYLIELFGKFERFLLIGVIVLYGLLLGNFTMIYFYHYPIQGQSDFPVRVLSRYVALSSENGQKVLVQSQTSGDLFKKHLFYVAALNKETIGPLKNELFVTKSHVGSITFDSCNDKVNPTTTSDVIVTAAICDGKYTSVPHNAIPQLFDGGSVFNIYNDKLCHGAALKPYPSGLTLKDFEVEKLSKEEFCQAFISSTR